MIKVQYSEESHLWAASHRNRGYRRRGHGLSHDRGGGRSLKDRGRGGRCPWSNGATGWLE
jgi:hypothetical protein